MLGEGNKVSVVARGENREVRVKIQTLEVTPFAQNCRVLWRPGSSDAVVVDPGGDVDQVTGLLARENLQCRQIWLTHSHLDHCGGVRALRNSTGATFFGPEGEGEMRANLLTICDMYGLPRSGMDNCPEPDVPLRGGEVLEIGTHKFTVLFTPGHSPGHLCFYSDELKVILAGDTLFAGSIGRTDLPGGEHETLLHSIRTQILTLPDETSVMPGHGPTTTVGRERLSNPFLQ